MLTINNPEHSEQRQNVVPPTIDEIQQMIEEIECDMPGVSQASTLNVLQRLLDHYQNLQHFYNVVGGWEGLSDLLQNECAAIAEIVIDNAIEKENINNDVNPKVRCIKCGYEKENTTPFSNHWISTKQKMPPQIAKEYFVRTNDGVKVSEFMLIPKEETKVVIYDNENNPFIAWIEKDVLTDENQNDIEVIAWKTYRNEDIDFDVIYWKLLS